MSSQFYQDRFERPFPITMLFLECVSQLSSEGGEDDQRSLREVLAQALKESGVTGKSPSSDHLLYALRRLSELREKREADAAANEEGSESSGKRSFGSDYLKWLCDMDHQDLCFHAADYDLVEARRLYTEEDYETVISLSRQKADRDWHDRVGWFEACLFGFGGGYGDSQGENEHVFDLRKDRASAESALKAAGF